MLDHIGRDLGPSGPGAMQANAVEAIGNFVITIVILPFAAIWHLGRWAVKRN